MSRLLILFLCFLSVFGKRKEDTREVYLEGQGTVSGVKYWDGEFYEFYGVPYASVPTGRDKYKSPLPPTPFTETVYKANKMFLCPQVYYSSSEDDDDFLVGDEECLHAHIMAPKKANENKLVPVILFIHSGGFSGGSINMAKYHILARHEIVVATINYRVGAHGFACLGTEDIPGNAALKDIVAGLKWFKKHIKSFGGDPDRITLAGYSVGATLAELVALSKETEGLFEKLSLDSGSALAPYAINRDPIATARNIAISIGYEDTGSIDDLNEFLLTANTTKLLAASRNFFLKNSTFGFAPCIEKPTNPDAVITESPLDTLTRGNYGDFTVLTGLANMEGISRTSQIDNWAKEMNVHFGDFLPADLAFKDEKDKEAFIKELKQYYFNSKKITDESVREFIDYFGDSMFKYSIMKSAKLHAANPKRTVYLYQFSYVGKLNTKHMYMETIRGASHRDLSAYILDFYDWTRNHTDMDLRDCLTEMWADYIKLSNPTAYETQLLTAKWPKYTNKEQRYLEIGDLIEPRQNLFSESYELWDKAYKKHYWNPTAPNPAAYKAKPVSRSEKPVTAPTPASTPTKESPKVEYTDEKSAKQDSDNKKPTVDRGDPITTNTNRAAAKTVETKPVNPSG